jgi:hypothetical protein
MIFLLFYWDKVIARSRSPPHRKGTRKSRWAPSTRWQQKFEPSQGLFCTTFAPKRGGDTCRLTCRRVYLTIAAKFKRRRTTATFFNVIIQYPSQPF